MSGSSDARGLKKKMAVPPIPQPAPHGRSHGRRDRSRIRMEISRDQCAAFIEILSRELRSTPVGSKEFKSLYGIFWTLKTQMDRPHKVEP
jgi:hypothetical protein